MNPNGTPTEPQRHEPRTRIPPRRQASDEPQRTPKRRANGALRWGWGVYRPPTPQQQHQRPDRSRPMSAHDIRCECPTCRIQVAIELLETGRTAVALHVLRGASLRTWKTTKPKQPAKRSRLEEGLTGGGGQLRDDDPPPSAA